MTLMEVVFHDTTFPEAERPELTSILRRISPDQERGCWRTSPDEITVVGRLDGRGGSDVIEIVVRWGPCLASKIVKVGSADALRAEHDAYQEHLANASAQFAPIQAATPGVFDPQQARPGRREALVYDHVERFVGISCPARHLEDLVAEALRASP